MAVALGSASHWGESASGVLLLVTIGVLVPAAHEAHRPQDRSRSRDVAWTVAASAVATGLFAGGYLLAGTVLADPTHRGVLAFGGASIAGWTLSSLLGRKR